MITLTFIQLKVDLRYIKVIIKIGYNKCEQSIILSKNLRFVIITNPYPK